MEYKAFILDLRNVGIHSLIDRIVSASEEADSEVETDTGSELIEIKLSLEEATKLVKLALKYYSSLPFQPSITESLLPLLKPDVKIVSTELVAHHIQEKILEIIHLLEEGNEEDQYFYRILYYAYIKKIGSHGRVAEYLNMSIPSYYRYLRKAVKRLAYEIIKPAN